MRGSSSATVGGGGYSQPIIIVPVVSFITTADSSVIEYLLFCGFGSERFPLPLVS